MNKAFIGLLFSLSIALSFGQTVNVAITQNAGQLDPTNTSPVVFQAVFSEAVTGFGDVSGDVVTSATTTTGTINAVVAGSGTTYTITVSGMTSSGDVIITIPANAATATAAPAGRMNVASTNTDNTVAYDITSPIAFSTNTFTTTGGTQVSGYWNSTNTGISVTVPVDNDGTLTGGTIQLQGRKNVVSFADVGPVYNIAGGDLGNSKIRTLNAIQFEGISGGIVDSDVVEIRAVITDNVGNSTIATNSHLLTIDQTSPTVTFNQDPGPPAQADPTSSLPVRFRAVFNEPINPASFVNGDVNVTGSASGKSVTGISQVNPPNDGTTWQININATGSGTIIADLNAGVVTDVAGNSNAASTFTDKTITVDITPPTVNSHSIVGGSTTTSGFTYRINVSEAGTTYWEVTTSSTPPTGAQIKAGTGPGHFSSGSFAVPSSSNTDQPISGLSGSTTYYIYSVTEDALGNQSSPVVSDNTTTLCVPPVTQASVVGTSLLQAGSVTISWTRGSGDNVIVMGRQGSASSVTPTNGTTYSADASFGDGDNLNVSGNDYFVVYNGNGTSVPVTNLSANKAYNFKVFEYNNTGVCYNPAETASVDFTTPSASSSSTITGGSGAGTIPSTTNSSPGINSFSFTITDAGDDGSDTDITQFIFTAGTGNDIADWTQVIEDVELVDNAGNGNEDYGTPIIQTSPNRITIPSITNNGNDKLGDINDGAAKVYTLRVWLKSNVGGLKSSIDNKNLVFQINAADISTNNTGILAGQTANSGPTNNSINVVASAINTTQQPSTTATATVALAQQPIYEAVDANGNRDLDFNGAITVNTGIPDNLAPTGPPANFSSGVADFTGSGFNFASTGMSTMSVTANAITSANSSTITVSAATTLAGGTTGTAPGPNLNNGASNQAVLGFSLQTTGSALNFTGATISTTSDPDVVFNNIRIYSSATADFSSATNIVAPVPTTPGNSINFSGFSAPVSGTISYFFVVADVNNSFSVSNPTIQLSLTTANTSVSVGSTVGTTQTGMLYSFVDTTPPTILSIANQVNPIFEGALTQTVVVKFSEPMNATGAFNPVVSLTGSNWGGQAAGSWSTTTFSNDTYTTTFTHSATQETIAAATASIAANTAKDLAGNATTNAPQSSASFVVDNQKPTATIGLSASAINTNSANLTLTVTYNEPMDNTQFPTITFNPANGNLSAPAPTIANWNPGRTVFTITYTHDLTPETIASITARANGAFDENGNVQTALAISPAFTIDTQRPSASISTSDANGFVKAGQAIVISATFSEPLADAPVVKISLSGANTVTPTNMTKISTTLYTYNHVVGAGNGTITFALSVGTDVAGNIVQSAPTAGATIIADDTPPLLSSLSPPDNSHNRQVGENLSITLADANTGILKGSGTISLFIAGGALVESFDVATSPLLTISPSNTLIINPTLDLSQATSYYIIIPSGAITDLAGNPFAGFALDTDWNFVTFGPPMITGVAPLTGTAVCIGTDVVITGSFLTGVTEVRFNGAGGLLGTNLNVVSDTEIRAKAPLNAQPGPIYVRKAPFGTNPDVNTTSASTVQIGPSSAVLSVGTINNTTVCTSGTIISSSIKITVTGGVGPYSATYRVVPGAMAPIDNLVPSYTSGADIIIDPPGTNVSNVYTIFSVQDFNGCAIPTGPPIGDQRSGSYAVFENQRPTVDAGGPATPPFNYCLANGNNIALDAPTLGTAPSMSGASGVTWTRNGSGTFSNANILQPTYTISSFDILNNNLQLTLTTTGNPTACDAAVDILPINFVSNSTANPGGSGGVYNFCWDNTPNPPVQLNGSIAGGATGYQWNSISGLNTQFSNTTIPNPIYTFNATETTNGYAEIELTPTGGTCGGPGTASPLRINLNPVPTNSFISPKTNVCVGETVTYKVSSTSGNTYNWTVPTTGGTTFENNGNSINVTWGNTTGPYQISVVETRGTDGCQSASIDLPVNLNEEPVPAFTSPNARIFGNKADPVQLTGSGDINNGTTNFSGTGVFINGSNEWYFSPANAGIGNNYPIRYTYTSTTTGCSNFKEELFTVFDGDQSIVLYPSGDNLPEFCADEDAVEIKLNPAISSLMPADQNILVGYVITGQTCFPPPFNFCFPIYSPVFQNITYEFTGFTGPGITTNTTGVAPRNTDGRATFDPKQITVGGAGKNVDLVYYYQEYIDGTPNGAPKEFGRQTITINPVPTLFPNFGAIQNTLCSNNAAINLTKNETNNPGTNFTFFVSPTVNALYPGIITGNSTSGFVLDPSAYNAATFDAASIDLFYGYEDTKGCNDTTSVAAGNTLRISLTSQPPAPVIDIGTNICITDGSVPIATITNVVSNSAANANTRWFNNINLNPPTLSQNPDFAAPINPAVNNTFSFFAAQEINGCISPVTQLDYEVLNVPAFSWDKFCVDGGNTQFDINLGSVNATDLTWSIFKSDATLETSQSFAGPLTGAQSFQYLFNTSDRYDVTANVTSVNGCVASRTQPVILLDKFTANENQIYTQDFEGGSGGFISLKDNNSVSNSTWDYGVINKTTIKNPTDNPNNKGWVTNLSGAYNNGERSYLYSGCLDITGLQRPMITFSSWTNTDDKNDGVVLQYSVDNKVINDPAKEWNALGEIGTGLSWYNRQLIQSIPGNKPTQNYGWSGDFDKAWKSSKHSLDEVAEALQAEGTSNVVFRFAFAATNPALAKTLDGFAIDSVFIGNRTRTILLENFTNKGKGTNAALEKNQSNTLKAFNPGGIGTKLVKINYHVGFPGEDPFNLDNAADPSARALYYNITNTPSALLDGEKPEGTEQPFSQWGDQEYKLRTLQLGQSEIAITPNTNADGSINIMVDVTPNSDLPKGTRLHVAILEEQIDLADLPPERQKLVATDESSFEYVLKKMLPSAPGLDTGPLNANTLYNFGPFSWYPQPSKLYGQPNDLAVVAFLQDEKTKEIYQAEILTGISDPPLVTGMEDILSAQRIEVFPNPADQEVTMQLPNVTPNKITIQLVDQVGRPVYNGFFEQGEQFKTISTRDLAGGIYLIKLGSGKLGTHKKVMVVHNK